MNEFAISQQSNAETGARTSTQNRANEDKDHLLDMLSKITTENEKEAEDEEEKQPDTTNLHYIRASQGRERVIQPDSSDSDPETSDGDLNSLSRGPTKYSVVVEAILQRVKTSFDNFQEWEQARSTKLNNHHFICQNLLQKLSVRVSLSSQGTEGILKFFIDRKNQIEYHCALSTKNYTSLSSRFEEKPFKDALEVSWTEILREYDGFHLRQAETNRKIAFFIQNKIIVDIRLAHGNAHKLIHSFEQRLIEARKKIKNINSQMERKGTKYTELVSRILNQGERQNKKNQKDLYGKELSMIACAQRQTEIYQEFSREVIQFCKLVQETETLRFETIKQALSNYIELLSEVYGADHGEPETVIKLLQAFEIENELKSHFSLCSLLVSEDLVHLKSYGGLGSEHDLTNEEIVNLFENYQFEAPKAKPLVLKEWEIFMEGGRWRSFKPYSIVLALGGNLLLLDQKDKKLHKKAEVIIKLSQVSLKRDIEMKNPYLIELIETKPGFFMNSKKSYIIQFEKIDHIDEFSHCLDDLQSY